MSSDKTPAASRRECDGSSECRAKRHLHGCFADRGNCDHPNEHAAVRRDLDAEGFGCWLVPRRREANGARNVA